MPATDYFTHIYEQYKILYDRFSLVSVLGDVRENESGDLLFDVLSLKDGVFVRAGKISEEDAIEALNEQKLPREVNKQGVWAMELLISFTPNQTDDEGRIEASEYYLVEHFADIRFLESFEERDRKITEAMKEADNF